MNADAKKTVLRMIPYGIYVLTADDGKGNVSAATVNWVTQSAFAPPLVVVGVKTDSGAYQTIKAAGAFALNMLGKDHKGLAFTFFKPAVLADGKLSGQTFRKGSTGAPILDVAPGAVECRVTSIVEQGDHHATDRPRRRRHHLDEGPRRQRVLWRVRLYWTASRPLILLPSFAGEERKSATEWRAPSDDLSLTSPRRR